jgi:hypothetical protein
MTQMATNTATILFALAAFTATWMLALCGFAWLFTP